MGDVATGVWLGMVACAVCLVCCKGGLAECCVCVLVGCGGVCRELCVCVCDVARLFGLVQCGVCMGWVWWRVM